MARTRKYLNLTDTDIDEIVDSFAKIIKLAGSDVFISYINEYYAADVEERGYDTTNIIDFCQQIYDFVSKKRDKLRVKTDLKLNKDNLFALIFANTDMQLNTNIRFWLVILFDFCFSKHEIYDHLDNIEETYKAMYDKYLSDYDLNCMETTY